MQRSLSTYLFRQSVLGAHLLDQIAAAGFSEIEIYSDRAHFDYGNESQVREVAEWFASSPVRFHSLHAPLSREARSASPHSMVSITFQDRKRREDSMDEIKRALETAEHAPFRYLVLHLGIDGESYDLRKFDAALTSLEHLQLFAGQRGVEILIENISNELSTPPRLREFFAHTHMRDLKVCLDTGHAHLDGGVQAAIKSLSGFIALVHLNDNGGAIDDHQFPPHGLIPWNAVLPALIAAAPQAVWTLEVRDSEAEKNPLEKARESFDQLERIANPDAKERA